MGVTHLTGHCLEQIKSLPDGSVDLVATSPPFLALRNYNDLAGQWGAEGSPAGFLANLLDLAVELRRVLTPTGSIAIELGDTFSGSGGAGGDYCKGGVRDGQPKFKASARRDRQPIPRQNSGGKDWPLPKSLTGVPTLFGWSLAYGRNLLAPEQTLEPWRIRNMIVWARNNPPVGALGDKFRPSTSYITVATPSDKRWFDLDAVSNSGPPKDYWTDECGGDMSWLVNSQGSKLAHYAMWPPALAERLILAMCPKSVCKTCGEPRRRIVEVEPSPRKVKSTERMGSPAGNGSHGNLTRIATTTGWTDCGHSDWRRGAVLDPFAGTGTTLAVADIRERDAIGIDLDPENEGLYQRRYAECWRSLGRGGVSPITEHGTQLDLLKGER